MAEAGLWAPDIPAPPAPQAPQQPVQQVQQMPHLNWSHFNPELLGKLEDVEAHLLGPNEWTHINFRRV